MKRFGLLSARKSTHQTTASGVPDSYWTLTTDQLFRALDTTSNGIQPTDAACRVKKYGLNALKEQRKTTAVGLLLSQFRSPLVLILIFAAIVSAFLGEWTDAGMVLAVVIGSTMLGFTQEYRASNAVEKLRSQVTIKSKVVRGGKPEMVPSEQVVPGDVVMLSAGSLVPADGIVLETNDFFVNQAVLTGEAFPVEKTPGIVPAKKPAWWSEPTASSWVPACGAAWHTS
jgi:Mg2+-importing ATPase